MKSKIKINDIEYACRIDSEEFTTKNFNLSCFDEFAINDETMDVSKINWYFTVEIFMQEETIDENLQSFINDILSLKLLNYDTLDFENDTITFRTHNCKIIRIPTDSEKNIKIDFIADFVHFTIDLNAGFKINKSLE